MKEANKGIALNIRHVPKGRGGGPVLLLGDQGELEAALRQSSVGLVISARSYIDGIEELQRQEYCLVLIHIEPVIQRIGELLAALAKIRPASRLVCYGPAWCEAELIRGNCVSCDFWPAPVSSSQVTRLLETPGARKNNWRSDTRKRQSAGPIPVNAEMVVQYLKELSAEIPNGLESVVTYATERLRILLGLDWVGIDLLHSESTQVDGPARQVVSLAYGGETVGRLLLGRSDRMDKISGQEDQIRLLSELTATTIALSRREQALRELATRDDLTGAHNRRYLEHFVQEIIESNKEEPTQATLLIFDIDDFKQYNDCFGHSAGDEILCEVTRLIRHCCREHDVVARFGGDEFIVLFWDNEVHRQPKGDQGSGQEGPDASHEESVLFMCNRFRRMIAGSEFSFLGPQALGRLSISGGVARFPYDGETLEALLEQADKALLEAKRQGKNRIYIAGIE